MTILVFNSGSLTVATGSWTVTERRDVEGGTIEVHILGSSLPCGKFDLTLAQFLSGVSAIAESGNAYFDIRAHQTNHKNG